MTILVITNWLLKWDSNPRAEVCNFEAMKFPQPTKKKRQLIAAAIRAIANIVGYRTYSYYHTESLKHRGFFFKIICDKVEIKNKPN